MLCAVVTIYSHYVSLLLQSFVEMIGCPDMEGWCALSRLLDMLFEGYVREMTWKIGMAAIVSIYITIL